jgi:hypothetical protein
MDQMRAESLASTLVPLANLRQASEPTFVQGVLTTLSSLVEAVHSDVRLSSAQGPSAPDHPLRTGTHSSCCTTRWGVRAVRWASPCLPRLQGCSHRPLSWPRIAPALHPHPPTPACATPRRVWRG